MTRRALDQALRQAVAALAADDAQASAAYDHMVAELRRRGVGGGALGVGDMIPAFALPDTQGRIVGSDHLLDQGPLVLSFFRGNWCDFCACELVALAATEAAIQAFGTQLIAISGEVAGRGRQTKRERRLNFEVLCDADLGVSLAFGLVFPVDDAMRALHLSWGISFPDIYGNESWFLPIPATYVVARSGQIVAAYVDPDFRRRMDPDDILDALTKLDREDPARSPSA